MSPERPTTGASSDGSSPRTAATSAAETAAPPPDSPPDRIVDPRAVRVALGPAGAHADSPPIVIEPPAVPLAPAPDLAGTGLLGGAAAPAGGFGQPPGDTGGLVMVDGTPTNLRLDRSGPVHAILAEGLADPIRTRVLLLPLAGPSGAGREVAVDGWSVEVAVESERRASLLERARRGRAETADGGPTEVHAIIPGRVVSVSVVAGDPVVAGQQLLVVEAMKMQNELRAPRDGVISRVAVGVGRTIEVGDLMLVLE